MSSGKQDIIDIGPFGIGALHLKMIASTLFLLVSTIWCCLLCYVLMASDKTGHSCVVCVNITEKIIRNVALPKGFMYPSKFIAGPDDAVFLINVNCLAFLILGSINCSNKLGARSDRFVNIPAYPHFTHS